MQLERELTQRELEMELLEQQMELLKQRNSELQAAQKEWEEAEKERAEKDAFSAEGLSYQLLYPDFYAPERTETAQIQSEGVIYLTFDDGPSQNTDKVLKILQEKDVKATFFVTGRSDEVSAQRLRAIVEQGHTLGMHSYTHDYDTIYASVEAFLADMYRVFNMIREATGVTPTVFRFPGGSINGYNSGIYQELTAEMLRRGFVPYDWNMSAQDATAKPLSVETVIQNVMSSAGGQSFGIVLMHDSSARKTTVQALSTIIDRFRAMGFQFDRLQPEVKPVLFSIKYSK